MRPNDQFLRRLYYMGVTPLNMNGRRTRYTMSKIYSDYIYKIKLERIVEDIENSKKGIYYLIEYLINQKQHNISERIFKELNPNCTYRF